VVRHDDGLEELKLKTVHAAILGTLQASLVDFRYLRTIWKKNTEEEALLGLSMTGISDNAVMSERVKPSGEKWGGLTSLDEVLDVLQKVAIETNVELNPQLPSPVLNLLAQYLN
jgi:ribonucleoside-diphosphate reductase alpha chain